MQKSDGFFGDGMKREIEYLVMDVDGTLTDGKIYIGDTGEVFKAFNVKDGCGIHDILIPAGIIPIVITGRQSAIVLGRCKELGITEVYQGVSNKMQILNNIIVKNDTDYSHIGYIGDDINDYSCMEAVKTAGGLAGCPADAVQEIKAISDYVCSKNGGDGAVREFIEWVISVEKETE